MLNSSTASWLSLTETLWSQVLGMAVFTNSAPGCRKVCNEHFQRHFFSNEICLLLCFSFKRKLMSRIKLKIFKYEHGVSTYVHCLYLHNFYADQTFSKIDTLDILGVWWWWLWMNTLFSNVCKNKMSMWHFLANIFHWKFKGFTSFFLFPQEE